MANTRQCSAPTRDLHVYHERQQLWRCGLHATNALLKHRAYTAADFAQIADSLVVGHRAPWFHPHRSVFGLGDYDVNVLMIALDRYRVQANWVPAKTPLREVIEQNPNIKGFLVNVPSIFSLPSFMSFAQGWLGDRRHWVAVPKYCKYYYLVDSKAAPSRFEDQAALIRYLEKVQKESGHVLYLVGKSDSERPMR